MQLQGWIQWFQENERLRLSQSSLQLATFIFFSSTLLNFRNNLYLQLHAYSDLCPNIEDENNKATLFLHSFIYGAVSSFFRHMVDCCDRPQNKTDWN